jgi:RNA polymerase sigma-70 factor (ECF subfamily)
MPDRPFESLLDEARQGTPAAQGELLRRYESWLTLLARIQLESQLRAKFDPSDIVQQAMVDAIRGLSQFRGTTEAELTAWLRQVLARALAHELRRYLGTRQRDVSLEVSLDAQLARSSQRLGAMLAGTGTSPSEQVIRREADVQLADALSRLSDDHRQVLVLRHLEDLSHEQIAERMDRSVGAIRMLWTRALAALRAELVQIRSQDGQ